MHANSASSSRSEIFKKEKHVQGLSKLPRPSSTAKSIVLSEEYPVLHRSTSLQELLYLQELPNNFHHVLFLKSLRFLNCICFSFFFLAVSLTPNLVVLVRKSCPHTSTLAESPTSTFLQSFCPQSSHIAIASFNSSSTFVVQPTRGPRCHPHTHS